MKPFMFSKSAGLMAAMSPGLVLPAGVQSVRMESAPNQADVRAAIAELQTAWAQFRQANDDRVSALEKRQGDVLAEEKVNRINAAIDEINQRIAGMTISAGVDGGPNARANSAEARAHATAFNRYFRTGAEANLSELEVKAALRSDSDPDGGFLVPVTTENAITRVLQKVCVMRTLAQVMTISTSEYRKPVSQGGAQSGWVGQGGPRPKTAGAKLTFDKFEAHEIYAQPEASQQLLDDAAVDIAAWLADEVTITFAEQEGLAFVSGDGVVMPHGILAYDTAIDAGNGVAWGKLGFVKTGAAADFGAAGGDNLIDLQSSLKTGYQVNAQFLMNRLTQASVRKLKDDQGRYLWEPAMQAGDPASIFGKPIAIDDNMPNVGAGNYPVAYGDFRRGYLIVDRIGVRVIRDNVTSKPNVLFYTTKRVGGGVQNFEAIKLLKCAA